MIVDHITPKWIIQALGPFNLDPCAHHLQPWPCARDEIRPPDNGLSYDWYGNVWLNPPYDGREILFLKKLAAHGKGIALLAAKTDTKVFFDYVWPRANGIYFFEGRIKFYNPDGSRRKNNFRLPSVLVAYNSGNADRLRKFSTTHGGRFLEI